MGAEIKSLLVTDRVQAGMAFLDEHYPDHVATMELDNLQVNSGAWCPLAQAADDFYTPAVDDLAAKGIDLRACDDDRISMAQELGFLALDGWGGTDSDDLDRAWIEAYEQRKAMINA